MEPYKLPKPRPIRNKERIFKLISEEKDIFKYVQDTNTPEYLFWDKVRYKPRPKGLAAEEFWEVVKFFRRISLTRAKSDVRDEKGNHFTWQSLPSLDRVLHEVDMQLGGALVSTTGLNDSSKQWYISRGIMEEAIASSQLEGANTTRKAAKKMLLEQRKPANQSEQMILNNYQAMKYIEEEFQHENLTIESLHELQAKLTQGTAINEKDIGRFRKDEDGVYVGDKANGRIYHIPPSEKFLKGDIKRFIDYSNDANPAPKFLHPLIKAIKLHFWIGYLHPYVDGNGRLARTIFYWYLLRKGYWAFSFLPISRVIRNSPAQYRDAYLFTEQDDYDLTYFIDYNIRKIEQAKHEFENYINRKETENRRMTAIAKKSYGMNERQIQSLRYLTKNTDASTSIKGHSTVYNISRMTAKKDLEELEEMGFLQSLRRGRDRLFSATRRAEKLLG